MVYCFFDASTFLFHFGKEAPTSVTSPASCLKRITPLTISNREYSLKTRLGITLVICFNTNTMCLCQLYTEAPSSDMRFMYT